LVCGRWSVIGKRRSRRLYFLNCGFRLHRRRGRSCSGRLLGCLAHSLGFRWAPGLLRRGHGLPVGSRPDRRRLLCRSLIVGGLVRRLPALSRSAWRTRSTWSTWSALSTGSARRTARTGLETIGVPRTVSHGREFLPGREPPRRWVRHATERARAWSGTGTGTTGTAPACHVWREVTEAWRAWRTRRTGRRTLLVLSTGVTNRALGALGALGSRRTGRARSGIGGRPRSSLERGLLATPPRTRIWD
jgi:hypothetical protein